MTPENTCGAYALPVARLYPDQHLWTRHQVAVPPGIDTVEKVCNPALWSLCSFKLKPLDVLDVVTDDGTVSFELRVAHVNPGIGATVVPMTRYVMAVGAGAPNPSATNTTGAGVFYRGPHRLYCVEREGRTLKEHFETADQAWGWLAQYNRTTSPQEAA